MRDRAATSEAGFSLIELLMAMVVTMIVTGAIYGLLSGGQSAFKVQPERTERQQNIRNAMDAIMRDIATAGVGLPDLTQTFTTGLDGAGAPGPNGPTDILEMVTNPDNFPLEDVCRQPGTSNAGAGAVEPLRFVRVPPILTVVPPTDPPRWVILLAADGQHWAPARVTNTVGTDATGDVNCAGAHNVLLGPTCTGSGFGNMVADPCEVSAVSLGDIIRYDIRIDPTDNVPSLWRSHPLGGPADVMVARGVEDLQVEYVQANMPGVCDAANPCGPAPLVSLTLPPPSPNTDYNTIITQVQVTLAARSNVRGLQGEMADAAGRRFLRGSLTSTGSPRAALYAINRQQPLPPGAAPIWQ
jgi:prepilin-type N-terminal cleavage/methylation domain-containing protein